MEKRATSSSLGSAAETTEILNRWRAGDASAAARVLPRVYSDLRRIATGYARRERPDHTLQATAIVHEAYLRLLGQGPPRWQSRAHFVATAAKIMRHILVDHSRRRSSWKRGGRERRLTWSESLEMPEERAADLIAVDEALKSLGGVAPEEARLVELRFFAGLSIEQTADCLGVSRKTVVRRWRRARAFLHAELGGDSSAKRSGPNLDT